MAERKTDYTNDVFGDWVVGTRVEKREEWMAKGVRYWNVSNSVTLEERVVEQTKLKDLPKEKSVEPVALATWASGLPVADAVDYQTPDDEDYHVGEAPPVEPNSVESVRTILGKFDGKFYEPRGDQAESAMIARKLIEQSRPVADAFLMAEAVASVALDNDPECSTYTMPETHWAAWAEEVPTVVIDEKCDGIGEAAESTVSEAELDERVPPQDPMRASVRLLMGQIAGLQDELMAIDQLRTEAALRAEGMMELADQLLKALITK